MARSFILSSTWCGERLDREKGGGLIANGSTGAGLGKHLDTGKECRGRGEHPGTNHGLGL